MKFAEIPQRLSPLLHPPDPIVINHLISVDSAELKKTACYDIDVEVDDTLKAQMNNFLLSTASQLEIQVILLFQREIIIVTFFFLFKNLDSKIHETVESINQLKISREFFLGFAKDPQHFINKWLVSQTRDLKVVEFVLRFVVLW